MRTATPEHTNLPKISRPHHRCGCNYTRDLPPMFPGVRDPCHFVSGSFLSRCLQRDCGLGIAFRPFPTPPRTCPVALFENPSRPFSRGLVVVSTRDAKQTVLSLPPPTPPAPLHSCGDPHHHRPRAAGRFMRRRSAAACRPGPLPHGLRLLRGARLAAPLRDDGRAAQGRVGVAGTRPQTMPLVVRWAHLCNSRQYLCGSRFPGWLDEHPQLFGVHCTPSPGAVQARHPPPQGSCRLWPIPADLCLNSPQNPPPEKLSPTEPAPAPGKLSSWVSVVYLLDPLTCLHRPLSYPLGCLLTIFFQAFRILVEEKKWHIPKLIENADIFLAS